MSAEIVVEGDDYRFSTDAWSRYTGRQIIVGAMVAVATVALYLNVSIGSVVGALFACIALVCAFSLWPYPWEYGEPIDGELEAAREEIGEVFDDVREDLATAVEEERDSA